MDYNNPKRFSIFRFAFRYVIASCLIFSISSEEILALALSEENNSTKRCLLIILKSEQSTYRSVPFKKSYFEDSMRKCFCLRISGRFLLISVSITKNPSAFPSESCPIITKYLFLLSAPFLPMIPSRSSRHIL